MQDFPRMILFFLLALGPLVVFHELGHYWVARLCGVKVLRFSIGLGRPIWTKKFAGSDTEWCIGILPLGGYVKMLDARDTDLTGVSDSDLKAEFTQQNVWKRIAIVAAGPIANFVLAIGLFTFLLMNGVAEPVAKLRVANVESSAYVAGLRQGDVITAVNGEPIKAYSEFRWQALQAGLDFKELRLSVLRAAPPQPGFALPDTTKHEFVLPLSQLSKEDFEGDFLAKLGLGVFRPEAKLVKVLVGGPAANAGLTEGDVILKVNGRTVRDGQDLVEFVSAAPEQILQVEYRRQGQILTCELKAIADTVAGQKVGRVQVQPDGTIETVTVHRNFFEALKLGNQRTWEYSALTLKMLGKIVTGQASLKNITGPITIADYADQAARLGLEVFIAFLATISISLGVMNLLPIPVLDGGHLLYYSLEVLSGKAIPVKYLEMAQRGGLVVLMCLMIVALFNDIVRKMS